MSGCCRRIVEVAICILPVERPLAADSQRKLGATTRDTISLLDRITDQTQTHTVDLYLANCCTVHT